MIQGANRAPHQNTNVANVQKEEKSLTRITRATYSGRLQLTLTRGAAVEYKKLLTPK